MRIFLMMILLISLSCSSAKKSSASPQEVSQIKIDLVFEKEIRGVFFNLNMSKPYGLAVDFQKNIYLSDAGNNRIIKFDRDLKPLRQIGGFGSSEGQFNLPTYISFDNGLNMMVSDEKNRRVARFNSQLLYVDELEFTDEEDPLKFGYPSGITFTNYGEVWIADRDNNQIAIFNNIGKYSHSLGEFGASGGQLQSPEKIIRDQQDNFLVCDAGNKRIIKYDSYGSYVQDFKNVDFEYPISVLLYQDKMFVLDSELGSIFCMDKNGQMLAELPSLLLGDKTALLNPSDFIFIAPDKILIADTDNNRLVLGKLIIEE